MDSTDTHNLTDDQIERLAAILVEDFGPGLHRTEFDNIVLLMFEDIAGLHVMPQQQVSECLRVLWITYRRLVTSNRSH
ncbi:MAG: hypothetical protein WDO56_33805 [Gammaproteobacteria bacterium]